MWDSQKAEHRLVAKAVGQARDGYDIAMLDLRLQMDLAQRRDMSLVAIGSAASMLPAAAGRFLLEVPPCGLTALGPPGCLVCPQGPPLAVPVI